MINREYKTVVVSSYSTAVDSYGQRRQGTPTTRNVQMVIHEVSHSNVTEPKFAECDVVGLTKDASIAVGNTVTDSGNTYTVKYVVAAVSNHGYTQVFMSKMA